MVLCPIHAVRTSRSRPPLLKGSSAGCVTFWPRFPPSLLHGAVSTPARPGGWDASTCTRYKTEFALILTSLRSGLRFLPPSGVHRHEQADPRESHRQGAEGERPRGPGGVHPRGCAAQVHRAPQPAALSGSLRRQVDRCRRDPVYNHFDISLTHIPSLSSANAGTAAPSRVICCSIPDGRTFGVVVDDVDVSELGLKAW